MREYTVSFADGNLSGRKRDAEASRTDNHESYTARVLAKTFPEELSGLAKNGKSVNPDLLDEASGIGVEVTSNQHGDNSLMRGVSHAKRLVGKVPDEDALAKLSALGITQANLGDVFAGYVESFWVDESYEEASIALKAKLKKLNKGNYDVASDVRLAIYDELDVLDAGKLQTSIESTIDEALQAGKYKRLFSHVYVLNPSERVVYDYCFAGKTLEARELVY